MTKHFSQGRDLDLPLVDVPADARPPARLGLRLYAGFLWFVFAFAVVALVLRVVWVVLS